MNHDLSKEEETHEYFLFPAGTVILSGEDTKGGRCLVPPVFVVEAVGKTNSSFVAADG